MKGVKVYEYSGCSTCKSALKFLDARKVAYEKIAIVDQPPTRADLKRMLELQGGALRKLFNTSGQLYRELGVGEKLGAMSEAEALDLLSKHGKLVKRPFVLGKDFGFVGFKEEDWKKIFG